MIFSIFAGVLSISGGISASAQPVPDVVVSIPPIHSLISGIMEGIGEPVLLIKGGASPHTYALRPSDATALEGADVVFWVGESLEIVLSKPLTSLAGRARIVELMDDPGIHLIEPDDETAGPEGAHEADRHDDHDEHEADHRHDIDPHVWLSPENAIAIVRIGVAVLSETDPDHAEAYRANGEKTAARVHALRAEMRKILTPVAGEPFVVFHDAYRYLETAFGIHAAGALTVSPDRLPGAGRLAELRETVEHLGATCVFREPQFTPKLAEAIVEGTRARLGVLDPLGADLEPGPGLYFDLMRGNAESLAGCLSGMSGG